MQNGSVALFTRQNHQLVAPNTTIHFEDTEDTKVQEKKKERLSFGQKLKLKMHSVLSFFSRIQLILTDFFNLQKAKLKLHCTMLTIEHFCRIDLI